MKRYKTYLVLTVQLDFGNSQHRLIVHKEISLPPMFVPGMYISFGKFSEKVKDILWHDDKKVLELYGVHQVYYISQGDQILEIPERRKRYFDEYIQDYVDSGWIIGNPLLGIGQQEKK